MYQAFEKLHACQYAIIRFLPFGETGEFANVGVLLACPSMRYFDYRLLDIRRTKRIHGFFGELDLAIYRKAMGFFRDDLRRLREMATDLNDGNAIRQLFVDLVYPRDTVLRFGETRAVMAESPEAELDQLFARYVGRDFVTRDYGRELEHKVRDVLIAAHLKDWFVEDRVGDDYVNKPVPFVYVQNTQVKAAIKPLNLDRHEPNQVLDAGGAWVTAVRRLRRHGVLPERFLFAVQEPVGEREGAHRAATEIVQDLREEGVQVVGIDETVSIVRFARAATEMIRPH
ncbi:DUF3037 domain-containing protein [Frateuria aurantia]|uniref:DUF3037 domain-containing protein n=1 Tax=Frateuria aurantia (strain ATCC 33424 / DSM 6220 / KCTC 2777 / LMG 1558 / NBRC 3245 / NCIMB 13370) TaxID=767434 RepID=H8L3C2_FRAAD|nr:DUF3037 domain-containing protein [Frateuria aurantia]AFC85558.1 Protein of unknown function (DUF3037) [Frateuria aurantia DSM 6220]